jgi:hypothetical protein
MTKRSCLILGDYINAWSLQAGLKRLGYQAQTLPRERYDSAALSAPRDAVLFFTDEAGWTHAVQGGVSARFLPRAYSPVLIDKLLFAEHLCAIGETPVPFAPLDTASTTLFKPPFVLKTRLSWMGGRKLPRGAICHTQEQAAQAIAALEAQGISRELLFAQQFLPDAENLSIAGFYDCRRPERRFFIATRKVLGDGGALNTGVLVETVSLPPELGKRVAYILDTLAYHGPFEMEFLYDEKSCQHLVLELNPRFWMQHGLFLAGYENTLIRAYLDEHFVCPLPVDEGYLLPFKPLFWVDRCYPFVAIAKGALAPLRNYLRLIRDARRRGYRLCGFPEWSRALRFAARQSTRRVRRLQRER